MYCYDGIHWNIYDILPYQRNFNFICSVRDLGKTYTTQKYVVSKCIDKGVQFIYICRTSKEKDSNVLSEAFSKVLAREFEDYTFKVDKDKLYWIKELEPEHTIVDDNGKVRVIPAETTAIVIGHCVALSEVYKKKRTSFPFVKYFIFDEYIIEDESRSSYVGGYKEPDRLLTLYHTVDRDEDRVVVFLLSNSLKFYNPYHIHGAFNLQNIKPGELWTSKNVLYQRPLMSEELKEKVAHSRFAQMVQGTTYGDMAFEGQFIYDNFNFIGKPGPKARYVMTLVYQDHSYGVWVDHVQGFAVITNKSDPKYKLRFALSSRDHDDYTIYYRGQKPSHLKWLGKNYKNANLRFETMVIKNLLEPLIIKLT